MPSVFLRYGMGKYDDIIDMPRPEPGKNRKLSAYKRAEIFGSFDALTGLDEKVEESGRRTDSGMESCEERERHIDEALNVLLERIDSRPEVQVVHFVPDERKEGGRYVLHEGTLRRIDEVMKVLHFTDGTTIEIGSIYDIAIPGT